MGGINTVKSILCIVKNIKPRTGLQNLVRDRYLLRVYSRWKMLSLFFMETYAPAGSQSLVNNVYSLSPEIIFNIMAGPGRIETVKSEKGFYTLREINTGKGTRQKTDRKVGQGDDQRTDQRADRIINLRSAQRADRAIDLRTEQRVDQRTGQRNGLRTDQRAGQRAGQRDDLTTDQRAGPVAGPGLTVSAGASAVSRIQDRAIPFLLCLTVPGAGSTILYKTTVNTIQKLLNQGVNRSGEFAQIEPGSGKKDSLQVQYHKRMMVINSLRNKYLSAMTAHNVINLAAPGTSDIRYITTNGTGQPSGQLRDKSLGELGSNRPKDERYNIAENVVHSELSLHKEISLTGIRGSGKGIKEPDGVMLRQERAQLSSEEFRGVKVLVHIMSRHLLEWKTVNVNRLPYEKISRYSTAGSIVYRENGEKLPGEEKLAWEAAKAVADKATKGMAGDEANALTGIFEKAEANKETDKVANAATDEEEKGKAIEISDDAVDETKGTVYKADHYYWDDISVEYQLSQDSNGYQLRQGSRRATLRTQGGETSPQARRGETSPKSQGSESPLRTHSGEMSPQARRGETSPQARHMKGRHMFVQNFVQNLVHRMDRASPKNILLSRLSKTAADAGGIIALTGRTESTALENFHPSYVGTAAAGSAKLVERLIHNVLGTFTQKHMERHLAVKESLERKVGKPSDENDLIDSYSSFKTEMEHVKSVFLLKTPGKAADEAPDMLSGRSERLRTSVIAGATHTNIAKEKRTQKEYRKRHSKTITSLDIMERSEAMTNADIVKSHIIVTNADIVNNSDIKEHSEVMKKKMTKMLMLTPPAVAQEYNSAYSKSLPPITYKSEESYSKAQQQQQHQRQQSLRHQQPQQVQQVQQAQQQPVMKSLNTPVEISPKTVRHTISDVDLMNPTELNRLVDKVYSQLETRLSRERRRFGY